MIESRTRRHAGLAFHDTLHHLPVVRQAVIASPFGMDMKNRDADMLLTFSER
jgi:hypothetical protein